MKFIIHCNDDSVIVEAETLEGVRELAAYETSKRSWAEDDCWSERVNE